MGSYPQKRVGVNYDYFGVMLSGLFSSMDVRMGERVVAMAVLGASDSDDGGAVAETRGRVIGKRSGEDRGKKRSIKIISIA